MTAPTTEGRCARCGDFEDAHDLPRHHKDGTISYTGCHDCIAWQRDECPAYVAPKGESK